MLSWMEPTKKNQKYKGYNSRYTTSNLKKYINFNWLYLFVHYVYIKIKDRNKSAEIDF